MDSLPATTATEPARRPGRHALLREGLILLLLVVVALAVRVVHLADWANTPLFFHLFGDEANFHDTAIRMISANGAEGVFFFQPLYSFFLWGVYSLFGADLAMVRHLHLVLAAGSVLAFYALGRSLGGVAVARLCALGIGLYGPQVFFEGQLMAPVLTVPLVAVALWAWLRAGFANKLWPAGLSGLCLGLAMMARPNLAVLVPVAGLWLLGQGLARKRWLLMGALALAGLGLGMLPAWIHNARQGSTGVSVSASVGHSFFLGNNEDANGVFHLPAGERISDWSHQEYQQSFVHLAEEAEGRPLQAAEVSWYWTRRGLSFWAEHPADALVLTGKKALLAINAKEHNDHYAIQFGAEVSAILSWLPGFGLVFPFAILGLVVGFRRQRGVRLLAWCAGAQLFTLVVFYVLGRYRIVVLPMLMPLAALGMVAVVERLRERRLRPLLYLGAWFLPALALTLLPMGSGREGDKGRYEGFVRMGDAERQAGKPGLAEQHYLQALSFAGPDRGATARLQLGGMAMRQGDRATARARFLEAVACDPELAAPRTALAELAEQEGDLEQAIAWWQQVRTLQADPRPADAAIARLRALRDRIPSAARE